VVRLCLASLVAVTLTTAAPRIEFQSQNSGVSARLRGISAVSPTVAWASGATGTILRTTDGGSTWQPRRIAGAEKLDFRDIDGFSDRVAYVLSIGPGDASRIYKTTDGGEHWDLQLANQDPKIFLDSMAFWDHDRGVAFSDSSDGKFVVFTTMDGGRTWNRVPGDRLPPALDGEGAFAGSGTNVAVSGRDRVWIGTTAGRVLRSSDAGKTWTISATPVHTDKAAGIFSIAFRGASDGIVVGGDFNKLDEAVDNAAFTADGGLTWALSKGVRGYRSVVVWSKGGLGPAIAIGPSGADFSTDRGRTWTAIGGEGYDTASFAPAALVGWAAGDKGRIARVTIHE